MKSGFELGGSQSINQKIKVYKIQINIYSILTKYQQTNINFIDLNFLKFCLKIQITIHYKIIIREL